MGFHENLRYYREKAGYTTKEIASLLNLSANTYAGYEIRGREPKFQTLCKMADLLHVSTDKLLGREDNILGNKDEERLQKLIHELLSDFDTQDTIKLDKGNLNGFLNGLSSEEVLFKINGEFYISISKKRLISKSNSIDSFMKLLGKELLFYYLINSLMNKREQNIKEEIDKNEQTKSNNTPSESYDNLYKMVAISNDPTMNTLYQAQKDIPNVIEQKLKEVITDLGSKESE